MTYLRALQPVWISLLKGACGMLQAREITGAWGEMAM